MGSSHPMYDWTIYILQLTTKSTIDMKTKITSKLAYIMTFLAIMAMVACQTTQGNKSEKEDETLTTDSIALIQEDSIASVEIILDYPTKGSRPLVDSLRQFLATTLGVDTLYAANPDSLLHHALQLGYTEMKKEYDDLRTFREGELPTMGYSYHIKKDVETNNYVTYIVEYYEYRGGAHGGTIIWGNTFRKDNGKSLGWNMLTNTDSKEFQQLIKDGIRSYFQANDSTVITDDQLKDMLIIETDIDHLPLPQFDPFLTDQGISFIYQQYEIAAYAMGLPSFVIPYDKLKPFLTQEVSTLF